MPLVVCVRKLRILPFPTILNGRKAEAGEGRVIFLGARGPWWMGEREWASGTYLGCQLLAGPGSLGTFPAAWCRLGRVLRRGQDGVTSPL